MKPYYVKVLKNNILFRNMSEGDIWEILDVIYSGVRRFEKNDIIMHDGEDLKDMAVILSGRVHMFHIDVEGNSNLLDTAESGNIIGMLNATGGYRLHFSAAATEHSELLFINVDSLLRENVVTDRVQIRFLQNLTLALAQNAHRLTVKLEDSVRRSTRDRIQDYLSVQYHKSGSKVFSIPLNRQELADFLFIDRSAMSKELCKMRDEGLIKFEKSRFELMIEMPVTDEEKDPND